MKKTLVKIKNFFVRLFEVITIPFISVAVMIDESRRQNLDGSWDKYWARRNAK